MLFRRPHGISVFRPSLVLWAAGTAHRHRNACPGSAQISSLSLLLLYFVQKKTRRLGVGWRHVNRNGEKNRKVPCSLPLRSAPVISSFFVAHKLLNLTSSWHNLNDRKCLLCCLFLDGSHVSLPFKALSLNLFFSIVCCLSTLISLISSTFHHCLISLSKGTLFSVLKSHSRFFLHQFWPF